MKLVRTILGFDKPSGKLDSFLHELFIFLAFCAFTAALTWPYVGHLRNAVVDAGDPYLVSWILWWDYHQTFTDPLNLFHSNLFYPLRYTLAFSEHCYGIALLFFPLFALGLKPVTVHAVAMFFGFALCGYGAFRLARTLTGSEGVAWVAGVVFAFVPYRFHLMSHLPYFFSPWIPLLFEALVLFAREWSRKRAVWLGMAFFMSGITAISWFTLSLVPFGLAAAILLTRYGLWRERNFWRRGAVALGLASLALLPFMLPYVIVSRLYGFKRSIAEVKANSAWPIHWLSVENRNKLWFGMGESMPDGSRFKLFPGLLPLLFSLVAVLLVRPLQKTYVAVASNRAITRRRLLGWLDGIIAVSLAFSIPAIGFDETPYFHNFFKYVTSARVLALLTVAVIARLCFAYPSFLKRGENANLVDTLRSERRGDAFWLGLVFTVVGFCYSLGWNFFFYRICYDLLPMFRSMRVPTRGAMIAYLGLALLAGLGVQRVAELAVERRPRINPAMVFVVACALLLGELNAAPLQFMGGDVEPDAVSLRLKQTPMSGGVVVLPAGPDVNHRHILRSADHQKPLIVGTSGFNSPYEDQIEAATYKGSIDNELLTLLENIPASYVVLETSHIPPERRVDYETFFARAVITERLRFINRFDGKDLFAVVKTEPQAKSEGPLPFALEMKSWADLIKEDPVHILGQYRAWSQNLYRFYVASYGEMPRYTEFLPDLEAIGRGIEASSPGEHPKLAANLNRFAEQWVEGAKFRSIYQSLTNERFIDTLSENAGITLEPGERATLIEKLNGGATTRPQALIEIVNQRAFVEKEDSRSLVLLHYFGYLRRNPDDPPYNDLRGLMFWVDDLERTKDHSRLTIAFRESIERANLQRK